MKNLKKVLALVLAFACAFTMFAGAAFTDEADISQTEAVDMLTALGVIKGYEDGSFKPDATITRAEAAKMIYTIRNGGNDNADAFKDGTTSFTDLKDDWYKGYVKYCQAMGIIAGKSATRFAPDETVTGTELAKMLLVTLGYDANEAGLTGAGWEQKTLALASENGLLDDVTCSLTAACPRQFAAQIMYNAINADIVVLKDGKYQKVETTATEIVNAETDPAKDPQYVAVTVTTNKTLGNEYMSLKTLEGVVTASGHTVKGYTMTVGAINFTKMDTDYADLMQQKVKVLYKATDDVYGVYATDDSSLVVETTVNGLDKVSSTANTFKADDVEYKTETAKSEELPVKDAMGNAITSIATLKDLTSANISLGSKVVLVDNDGNDKIDVAVVTPIKVSKVNYVSSDKITLVNPESSTANTQFAGSVDVEEAVVYDGIAKGDYVAYTAGSYTSTGDAILEKVDVVSGKITGVKSDSVLVDGNWYKTSQTTGITYKNGNSVDLFVVNGVAYGAKTTTAVASASSFLVVQGLSSNYGDVNAKVLLGDGSTKEVTISKVSTDGDTYYDVDGIKSGDDSVLQYTNSGVKDMETTGVLFSYKIVDDKYRLTPVASGVDSESVLGYDGFDTAKEYTDKEIDGNPISDDAVIFVKDTDGYKIVTGKAAKAWGTSVTSSNSDVKAYVYNNENGYKYVKVAYVTLTIADPGASDDKVYGYIVADPYESQLDNGDAATALTIWNGSDTISVLDKNKTTDLVKGDFIAYTDQGDGVIKAEKVLDYGTDEKQIFAYDGDKNIEFATKGSKGASADYTVDSTSKFVITDDTQILYIDSENVAGVSGGSIQIANKDTDGKLMGDNNAYVVSKTTQNGDGKVEIKLLVVEIANDIK